MKGSPQVYRESELKYLFLLAYLLVGSLIKERILIWRLQILFTALFFSLKNDRVVAAENFTIFYYNLWKNVKFSVKKLLVSESKYKFKQ